MYLKVDHFVVLADGSFHGIFDSGPLQGLLGCGHTMLLQEGP